MRAAVAERGWELEDQPVYRDDGYSGASLGRSGLDRLRDHAALADLDVVLMTAPGRLALNYVHQVLLTDELVGCGCRVEFMPQASAMNRAWVERRRNAGRSSSSTTPQVAGTGRLAGGNISGHSVRRWCLRHR